MRIVFSDDQESSSSESNSNSKDKNKKKKKNDKNKKNEKIENENVPKYMTLIRELKTEDWFGSFEVNIMKQNNTRFNKLLAYAIEPSKVMIFEKKII